MGSFYESEEKSNNKSKRIAVIGVGGAGCNMINTIVDSNLSDSDFANIEFIGANTDFRALLRNRAKTKIEFGTKTCQGLGAGGNPENGVKAVEEDEDKFREILKNNKYHTVVVVCGLGGGTGTGSAPEICRIAKQEGAYTVAIVGYPFRFEGKARIERSNIAKDKLRKTADVLFVSKNDIMHKFSENEMSLKEAYKKSDKLFIEIIKAIESALAEKADLGDSDSIIEVLLTLQNNVSDTLIEKLIENLEIYAG